MTSTVGSVEQIQELVRAAVGGEKALEAVGGGTQLHVGYESAKELTPVSLTGLNQVVEYAPDDLVIIAQAGMTFSALQGILAEHGQTLPLEIALPERQTLGGIVASRASSLTRASNGSVRDWLIGCKAVCGEGQVIVGGGKVVKNVAGYDFPKLFCGSWGTLGILTEVAFKVAPLAPASQVLLVSLNTERNSEEALDAIHHALTPTFSYVLNPDAAKVLLGPDAPPAQFLALAFDGQPEAVESLVSQAKQIVEPFAFQILELPDPVGKRLRALLRDLPLRPAPLTARSHILPSQVGAYARMVEWTARRGGLAAEVFADAGAGIVWSHITPRDLDEGETPETSWRWPKFYEELRDKAERVGGSFIVERMPQAWREAGYPVWSPTLPDVGWMRKLKATFDPRGVFRPGRFVDHI